MRCAHILLAFVAWAAFAPCTATFDGFVGLGPTPADGSHWVPLIFDPDTGHAPWWSNTSIGFPPDTFLPFATTTGGPCPACSLQLLVAQQDQLWAVVLPVLGAPRQDQVVSQLPYVPSTVHCLLSRPGSMPGSGPDLLLIAATSPAAGTPLQGIQLDASTGKVVSASNVAGLIHNPDLTLRVAALSPQGVLLCRMPKEAAGGVNVQLTELYHILDNGTTVASHPNVMAYGIAVIAGTGYLVGAAGPYPFYQLYTFILPGLQLILVGAMDTHLAGRFAGAIPSNVWSHRSTNGPSLAFYCSVMLGRQMVDAVAFMNLTLNAGVLDIGASWYKQTDFMAPTPYTQAECVV